MSWTIRPLIVAAEFLVGESLELKILTWLESRELVINNQRRESFKSLILVNVYILDEREE